MEEVIETGKSIRLWDGLMAEYDGMPARNRIVVVKELFNRFLRPGERMIDIINEMTQLEGE